MPLQPVYGPGHAVGEEQPRQDAPEGVDHLARRQQEQETPPLRLRIETGHEPRLHQGQDVPVLGPDHHREEDAGGQHEQPQQQAEPDLEPAVDQVEFPLVTHGNPPHGSGHPSVVENLRSWTADAALLALWLSGSLALWLSQNKTPIIKFSHIPGRCQGGRQRFFEKFFVFFGGSRSSPPQAALLIKTPSQATVLP